MRHGYLFDTALCERARGAALASLGDSTSGRAGLERAADDFAAIGAKPEVERTHFALASLGDV
jgi:hypothetical protein